MLYAQQSFLLYFLKIQNNSVTTSSYGCPQFFFLLYATKCIYTFNQTYLFDN